MRGLYCTTNLLKSPRLPFCGITLLHCLLGCNFLVHLASLKFTTYGLRVLGTHDHSVTVQVCPTPSAPSLAHQRADGTLSGTDDVMSMKCSACNGYRDGLERITVDAAGTIGTLRQQISSDLNLPRDNVVLSKDQKLVKSLAAVPTSWLKMPPSKIFAYCSCFLKLQSSSRI